MLYSEHDLAVELAAQIGKTDLGVADASESEVTFGIAEARHNVLMRLDNGQEFLLTVTRFGGPHE